MEDRLWDRLRNNDQVAFTELYKAYYQFLFSAGFRQCSDKDLTKDCIHDMFLEIWNNRNRLPSVKHVGFYLKTYLRRKINNRIPKLNTTPLTEHEQGEDQQSYEDLLIAFQSELELKEKVKVAIRKLTPSQLEVIRLKFFDDKSYQEIAAYKSSTARTVYNQVYQSLKVLREFMK